MALIRTLPLCGVATKLNLKKSRRGRKQIRLGPGGRPNFISAGNYRMTAQRVQEMKKAALLLLLFAATFFSRAEAFDVNSVRAAAAYSAGQGGKSFLAIQHGQTLLEQGAREPHKIYSGTKAFWGLAALAAADDGLLSLDEHVCDTIPAWRN